MNRGSLYPEYRAYIKNCSEEKRKPLPFIQWIMARNRIREIVLDPGPELYKFMEETAE